MRRRSLITFVVLNVLISIGVALAVISIFDANNASGVPQVITVEVRITATTDPLATQRVVIITATPRPGEQQAVNVPAELFDGADGSRTPIATIDPALFSADAALAGTATALPQNCILHTVKEGDSPFGIALEYGADFQAIMDVNGLTDETASLLQIGDTLTVPLEGCPLTAPPAGEGEEEGASIAALGEATETEAATAAASSTPRPTVNVPPTATNAQVVIRGVNNAGDITAEAVEIQNTGATVNIAGWTLSDSDGNTYTFEEQLLFSEARLTVTSRVGSDTPVILYWGRDEAVWEPGDVVTLTDDDGNVQSTFRVPAAP